MSREAFQLPKPAGSYVARTDGVEWVHYAAYSADQVRAAYQAGMERAAQKVEEIEARCEAMDMDDPTLKEVAAEIRAEARQDGKEKT